MMKLNDIKRIVFSIEYIKQLIFFLIGIALVLESNKLLVIVVLLAIYICCIDKNRFSNFKNSCFNITALLYFLFCITVIILCILKNNIHGLKASLKLFEKISPLLIIYILVGSCKKALLCSAVGIVIGTIAGTTTVWNDFIRGIEEYGKNRFGGIYGNPNSLGAIIELIWPFLVYIIYRFKSNTKLYFCSILALVCSMSTLYLSGSRGAMMAVLVESIIFVAIYYFRRIGFSSWKKYTVYIFALIMISLLIFKQSYQRSYDAERLLAFSSTWSMFLDHYVLGVGYAQWGEFYKNIYISPYAKEHWLHHPHNVYLYILAETGVVGFSAFIGILFFQLRTAIHYSLIDFKITKKCLTISDAFIATMFGMAIHNMVDVYITVKFYSFLYFFLWSLCCLRFNDLEKYYQ